MKRIKQLIGVLCCFLALFAFSIDSKAMDFDAETLYHSVFIVYSGNYVGSGFAIGENTIITNAHVIGDTYDINLYSYEGNVYRASIYLIDNYLDIAVLSVEGASFTPLQIGDSDALKIGEDIYAIGAPNSMEYSLTKGIVSNKKRLIGNYDYIQIDAPINSGNSGGPLLNNLGQVVGVNSMKMTDAEGIALAIPISRVISFIENNGVVITDDNIVDGVIPFIENLPQNETDDNHNNYVVRESGNKGLTIFLSITLGVSVLLNVILIISIMYQKNKNKDYYPDASERTDFDIDIQE